MLGPVVLTSVVIHLRPTPEFFSSARENPDDRGGVLSLWGLPDTVRPTEPIT
jgi:hypothetical protein